MSNFNKVFLMGNLTRDPQSKFLSNQTAVTDFGLAVNRKYKAQSGEEREDVLFVDCTAFGKQAEVINQYCTKGKPLFIEGRLKYDSWDDKNGGGKRSKVMVVVENFQFVGGRTDGEDAGPGEQPRRNDAPRSQSAPQRSNQRAPQPKAERPFGEEQQFKEADIPF